MILVIPLMYLSHGDRYYKVVLGHRHDFLIESFIATLRTFGLRIVAGPYTLVYMT